MVFWFWFAFRYVVKILSNKITQLFMFCNFGGDIFYCFYIVRVCRAPLRFARRIGSSVFCLVVVGVTPKFNYGEVICEGGSTEARLHFISDG